MSVFSNAGEDIDDLASVRFGILDAVRRQDRQSIMRGQIDKLTIHSFFSAKKMPLNLDINIFAAKSVDQKSCAIRRILGSARALACPVRRPAERNESRRRIFGGGAGNSTRGARALQSKECDQSLGELPQLVPLHRAFPLFAAQMRLRE